MSFVAHGPIVISGINSVLMEINISFRFRGWDYGKFRDLTLNAPNKILQQTTLYFFTFIFLWK